MTDFYFFDHKDKSTTILEKYLKTLSKNPESGIKCVNATSEKLKEFEDQRLKDEMDLYKFIQLNNQYNANDVMSDPAAAKELLIHLRKQRSNLRKKL